MVTFLITFGLLLLIGARIVNGWNEVTRTGRIFGFWEDFWEHYTQEKDTDEPEYRFPEWVRNPISACIMCMSSVYGSIIFWLTYYLEGKEIFHNHSIFEILLTWVAYCLALVPTNYIIHKKMT